MLLDHFDIVSCVSTSASASTCIRYSRTREQAALRASSTNTGPPALVNLVYLLNQLSFDKRHLVILLCLNQLHKQFRHVHGRRNESRPAAPRSRIVRLHKRPDHVLGVGEQRYERARAVSLARAGAGRRRAVGEAGNVIVRMYLGYTLTSTYRRRRRRRRRRKLCLRL